MDRVYAADLDSDGDLDVLLQAVYGGGAVWYEDGSGSFGPQSIIVWYENTDARDFRPTKLFGMNRPVAGDANRDGVLDQFDIVQVLQGGKYLPMRLHAGRMGTGMAMVYSTSST
jgi:hypothetical protein